MTDLLTFLTEEPRDNAEIDVDTVPSSSRWPVRTSDGPEDREVGKAAAPPKRTPPPRKGSPGKEEPEAGSPPKKPRKRAIAVDFSRPPWNRIDSETRYILQAIADAGRDNQMVRIRYSPKVQTAPGGPQAGKTPAVYRTVEPYSMRFRNIHTRGYDKPPVSTPVFFGYDPYKGTIKMFVANRIWSVERARRMYAPKWDVEFEASNTLPATLVETSGLVRGGVVRPRHGTTGSVLDVYDWPSQMFDQLFYKKQLKPAHWLGPFSRREEGTMSENDLWVVVDDRDVFVSRPLLKDEAVALHKLMIDDGLPSKIVPARTVLAEIEAERLVSEMTGAGACGSYEVPLGAKPQGQKRKKKHKKRSGNVTRT